MYVIGPVLKYTYVFIHKSIIFVVFAMLLTSIMRLYNQFAKSQKFWRIFGLYINTLFKNIENKATLIEFDDIETSNLYNLFSPKNYTKTYKRNVEFTLVLQIFMILYTKVKRNGLKMDEKKLVNKSTSTVTFIYKYN